MSSAIALGNFDGVHLGHQEILKNCILMASACNIEPVIVSFKPHPASVLAPSKDHKLIATHDDKFASLHALGFKKVIELDFNEKFAKISAAEFIKRFLVEDLQAKYVLTGCNFSYGNQRLGNALTLQQDALKYDFKYTAVNQISYNHRPVSSSLIKDCIARGLVETAGDMLGRRYKVSGIVTKGEGIASTRLNCATANFIWNEELIKPMHGVYLSHTVINNQKFRSLTNIGVRPTFHTNQCLVETHILDFKTDIYDQHIVVSLLNLIRPERRFESIEQLSYQISMDVGVARYMHNEGPFGII